MSRWVIGLNTIGLALAIVVGTGGKAPAQAADVKAGKSVFKRCTACHEADKEKNKVGPHLVGIVGRKAGFADKFSYSKSLLEQAQTGLVWNAENLDKYLTKPSDFIKNGKMAFAGLTSAKDRANLIAYLAAAAKAK